MPRAFVEDRFPLGWSETGEPCAHAIPGLLDVARPLGLPVVCTRGDAVPRG